LYIISEKRVVLTTPLTFPAEKKLTIYQDVALQRVFYRHRFCKAINKNNGIEQVKDRDKRIKNACRATIRLGSLVYQQQCTVLLGLILDHQVHCKAEVSLIA